MPVNYYITHFVTYAINKADSFGGLQSDPNPARKGNDDQYDAYRHALFSAKLAERFGDVNASKAIMDRYEMERPSVDPRPTNMDLWNNDVGREEYLLWKTAIDQGLTTDSLEKWIYDAVVQGKTIN